MDEYIILLILVGTAAFFGLFYWIISMAVKSGTKEVNDNLRLLLAIKEIERAPTEQELDIAEKKVKERAKWKPLIGTSVSANEYLKKMEAFKK